MSRSAIAKALYRLTILDPTVLTTQPRSKVVKRLSEMLEPLPMDASPARTIPTPVPPAPLSSSVPEPDHQPKEIIVAKIALQFIDAPAWNSRIVKTGVAAKEDAEKIARLAQSMKDEGQLTAIEVEQKPNGRYELVFGTRRLAAANLLQWTEIEGTVKEPTTGAEKIVRNVIENVVRSDLSTFEEGRAVAQLRELGLKNHEIGSKLGMSQQHVSNLFISYAGLPAPILKEWEKQNPAASVNFLRELANKERYATPEAQMREWDAKVAELAEREAAGQKPGKRGKAKKDDGGASSGLRLNQKATKLVIDLVKSKKTPGKLGGTKLWARQLVDFMLGQRATPPEGIDWPADDDE